MVQTVWFPSFRSLISVILAGICLGWIVDARLSHGVDVLDVLTALFEGKPWMPPEPLRI